MSIDALKQGGRERTYFDLAPLLMTGDERYPIIGDLLSVEKADMICSMFKGLFLTGSCVEKNSIASHVIGGAKVLVVGAMRVLSADGRSAYGFDWNPPTELHAWIQEGDSVIDLSLPGVIIRGMMTSDEEGPFLVGLTPAILAGPVPDWLIYEPKEFLPIIPH